MGTLSKCGEQYRRRYIERERLPPGCSQIRGRTTHEANERNLAHKLETGDLLELEEVQEIARDSVDGALQGEFVLGGDYVELGVTKARGVLKDEVVGLSTLHATEVAPAMEPEAIEVRVEVPAGGRLAVPLVGVIDLIDANTGIHDTKTAQKAPGRDDAHVSDQLTAYDLLHRALKGTPPKGLGLDVLVRTPKKGELRSYSLRTERTKADLSVYLHRVEAAVRTIEAEIFLPAPQDHWICSTRWCGYASTCPYFRGRPRPTS